MDNLFSYGESNKIDFSKNTGITGIFGKNTKNQRLEKLFLIEFGN